LRAPGAGGNRVPRRRVVRVRVVALRVGRRRLLRLMMLLLHLLRLMMLLLHLLRLMMLLLHLLRLMMLLLHLLRLMMLLHLLRLMMLLLLRLLLRLRLRLRLRRRRRRLLLLLLRGLLLLLLLRWRRRGRVLLRRVLRVRVLLLLHRAQLALSAVPLALVLQLLHHHLALPLPLLPPLPLAFRQLSLRPDPAAVHILRRQLAAAHRAQVLLEHLRGGLPPAVSGGSTQAGCLWSSLELCGEQSVGSRQRADAWISLERARTVWYSPGCGADLTRNETCPVSTEGGTRRVHLVRGGGGGEDCARSVSCCCGCSTPTVVNICSTRRARQARRRARRRARGRCLQRLLRDDRRASNALLLRTQEDTRGHKDIGGRGRACSPGISATYSCGGGGEWCLNGLWRCGRCGMWRCGRCGRWNPCAEAGIFVSSFEAFLCQVLRRQRSRRGPWRPAAPGRG